MYRGAPIKPTMSMCLTLNECEARKSMYERFEKSLKNKVVIDETTLFRFLSDIEEDATMKNRECANKNCLVYDLDIIKKRIEIFKIQLEIFKG